MDDKLSDAVAKASAAIVAGDLKKDAQKKKKMGRKPKDFDERVFRSLCMIQCTQEEICLVLNTTTKTLNAWCKRTFHEDFLQAYKRLSVDGKMSLRRSMFEKATKDRNTTMMIWLSKQYLGMRDAVQIDQTDVMNKLDAVLDGIKEDADSQAQKEEDD